MKYRCISYPDFEPNHTWLRQVLLCVDEIHRIMPLKEQMADSDELKNLMDYCEGAVHHCPPQPYVDIPESQVHLFGKAIDQPEFRSVANSTKATILIHPSGDVERKGWEFLHVEKIGNGIRRELCDRNMLRDFPKVSDWQLVPRGVGALVLSILADHIAREKGFDALTDQPLAFALNSLHGCSEISSENSEGIIASAIATIYIPSNISLLSAKEYAELREPYAGAG